LTGDGGGGWGGIGLERNEAEFKLRFEEKPREKGRGGLMVGEDLRTLSKW
jgi:hypothetical protein